MCGRCGQRLQVVYSGKDNQCITCLCCHRQRRYAEPVCQRIHGRDVDQVVTEAVLAALTLAQIELSLAVVQEIECQQAELDKQWELGLESARYAARLAQRRYEQVDPDNRLVARSLEREWEASLREVERLWHAATTSWTERKDMLQLLVADVTLTRQETDILVKVRWHTNELDTCAVPLPSRGASPVPEAVVERTRFLSPIRTDSQIADELDRDGIRTPQDKPFTAQRVQGLRRRYRIRKRSSISDP